MLFPKTFMMRCIVSVTISQQSSRLDSAPSNRNLVLNFNFCNHFEADSTWVNLTNKAKLILPKNVYITDQNNKPFPIAGNQDNTGSPDYSKWLSTLFRRGDKVSINYGYYFYDEQGKETRSIELSVDNPQPCFTGWISKVESKMPITLECEDNMWACKQIPVKNQVWPKTKTVEQLLQSVLANYLSPVAPANGNPVFKINALTETYIGDLQIQNMSVAQLLEYLRKHFHIEAYFLGDTLYVGSLVYSNPAPVGNVNAFIFQQNVISSELTYRRKDEVILSAVCESLNTVFTGKTNAQGEQKTKQDRLTVLVWYDTRTNPNGIPRFQKKIKNVDFPENVEGERRSLFFPLITDAVTLAKKGINELSKYYYTGFKGSFTTFGTPRVTQGDTIFIQDLILPDRNGFYIVKGVKYTGGVAGHRQIITLDYKQVVVNNAIQLPQAPTPV